MTVASRRPSVLIKVVALVVTHKGNFCIEVLSARHVYMYSVNHNDQPMRIRMTGRMTATTHKAKAHGGGPRGGGWWGKNGQ